MKVVFYLNVVSPHQLPLARAVARRVGEGNFLYVYAQREDRDHAALKFDFAAEKWIRFIDEEGVREQVESADLVMTGLRDLDLFKRRCAKGLKTYYTSERWFKPPIGRLRMLVPRYWKMARRFKHLARQFENFRVLPIGVHAASDFRRMGIPESKMALWGYFVAPSEVKGTIRRERVDGKLKVMWCGRPLALKRVETIEKAVARVPGATLDVYSNLSLEEVRREMRAHDVFVLASNGYEGWGAVVSEALEEGLNVIGTFEAGASATLLPQERLFHTGDVRALTRLLEKEMRGELPSCSIGEWSAESAAERFLDLAVERGREIRN